MPKCDMRDFVRQYGGEKRGETFPSLFWDVGDLRSEVLKQTQYAGNKSKPSAQKAPAANKTKPDPKTDSLKQ